MGCCLFASILAGAPRLASIIWWLFRPGYWSLGFAGWPIVWWLWPTLGILLLPWTTLMYIIVYPYGIEWYQWIFLGLAVAIDIGSYAGGQRSYSNR